MAFYGQAPERIQNRSPVSSSPRPRSVQYLAPAELQPNMETPTRWTPYGTFVPVPYEGGGHDALHGRLMDVPQADLYDASPNPWPNNGVWDEPNAWQAVIGLLRLPPHTSAHPGATLTSGEASPTMLFHAPPVFGMQTQPIPALGV